MPESPKDLMEFLMTDNGIEASYLKDLLYDLEGLFELMEGGKEMDAAA